MTIKTDVAIIGGGPGGTTAAMYLLREGLRPLIIERDQFPRYHIGESMTGECGGILRDLGLEEKMRAARHPAKQGVKVFGPTGKNGWFVPVMARTAPDTLTPAFTWQVRRSEFDKMMLDEAMARGAEFLRAEAVEVLQDDEGGVCGVLVRHPDGQTERVEARVTLDVSGKRTFFAHQGLTSDKVPGRYDKQVAIFSQVANPLRDHGPERSDHPDNTLIFYKSKFHWAWFIPLDDETVSLGVVAPGAYFAEKKESREAYLKRELQELNPELTRRLVDTTLTEEARAIPNYSYHCRTFTGKGWIAIGDAHRFIDPIFSFGLYVSMQEARLAAPVIRACFDGQLPREGNPFKAHQDRLERGLDNVQALIDGFWENPIGFAHLVHQSSCREDIIDLFAGRIYPEEQSPGLRQLIKLAATARPVAEPEGSAA
ncbi:MAG: tryptophan 7-halogenase [Gemmatimonadetes bacterium]|nr:tryptophan 7-halogenase [Gemmatimonadota bacterium]